MFKQIIKFSVVIFAVCIVRVTNVTYAENNTYSSELIDINKIDEWHKEIEEKMANEPIYPDIKDYSRAPMGSWSWRPGVICISNSKTSGFEHGHAGIIASWEYNTSIVEAVPEGVRIKKGMWTNEKVWQVTVKSTSTPQDTQAAQWAADKNQLPYNNDFSNTSTRDKFYCSHLVWAAYKDVTGVDVGEGRWLSIIFPYELMNTRDTTLIYRNH